MGTKARAVGRRGRIVGAAAAAVATGAAVIAMSAGPAAGNGWSAKAVLRDVAGNKVGTVRFEGDEGGTAVKVVVRGITTGTDTFHGLHVHANDAKGPCDPKTSPAFTNVGAHWASPGSVHGHHEGDLPSLLVQADGTGSARSVTARFDPGELAGRAVILHAGPDNLANVPDRYATGTPPMKGADATTKDTGDSGGRIACGTIVVE